MRVSAAAVRALRDSPSCELRDPESSMLGIRTMFRCILLTCFLGVTGLVVAEPLTFDSALELATRSSPDIAVQTASVEAAQSASVAAGRLPEIGRAHV